MTAAFEVGVADARAPSNPSRSVLARLSGSGVESGGARRPAPLDERWLQADDVRPHENRRAGIATRESYGARKLLRAHPDAVHGARTAIQCVARAAILLSSHVRATRALSRNARMLAPDTLATCAHCSATWTAGGRLRGRRRARTFRDARSASRCARTCPVMRDAHAAVRAHRDVRARLSAPLARCAALCA